MVRKIGANYLMSVQFSRSLVSDSLQPHESQHARPPCPSPTPGVYPNSCPSVGDAIQSYFTLSVTCILWGPFQFFFSVCVCVFVLCFLFFFFLTSPHLNTCIWLSFPMSFVSYEFEPKEKEILIMQE